MATTTTRPIHPVQPEDLYRLIVDHNQVMRTLNKAIRYRADARTIEGLRGEVNAARKLVREWYATPEGRKYAAAVAVYNVQARAWNAALKTGRQTRRNEQSVAKVRAAACPRCLATHAGEC